MASPPDSPGTERVGGSSRAVGWLLLVVAFVLVVALRSPDALAYPSLEAEDGTYVFPYYYVHRELAGLARYQAGYIPFVLNLFAFLAVRLPTRLIPYGFALLPMLQAVVACTWLYHARFREWLGSDAARAFTCVLWVLVPIAQYHVYANATYSIWNSLLLLVLLAVTPAFESVWANVGSWIALNVLVWSNPLSILASPLVALKAARDRKYRALHLVTLVNFVAYNSLAVEKGGIFMGLTWIESLEKIVSSIGWTAVLVAGACFRTAFGSVVYAWVETGQHWVPAAVWLVLVVFASIVLAMQSRTARPALFVVAYVVVVFTFVSVLSRGATTLFPLNSAPRYVYMQSLGFLVLFVLLVEHFVVTKWQCRRSFAYAAIVLYAIALNVQLGHCFIGDTAATRPRGGPWSPYVQSGEGNGRVVRDFFGELARAEEEAGSRDGIYVKTNKVNDWPIIIDTRPKPAR